MGASGIELAALTKSYRTSEGVVPAVRGIDVSVAAGETVALLGPNGAGKSTTIDMLLGLLDPDGGTVSVFGAQPRAAVDAGSVGGMLQTGALIRDLSVRELIGMMAALYPAPLAVDEVLELTGIADLAGRRTQKLSGGQTQRVRFAVALVCNPDLLVLDEPTVAMDVESRHAFWTAMREFAGRGKTVLFATHYLEEADAYADRVVLMARRQDRRRRPADRDQGDGRHQDDPGDAARASSSSSPRGASGRDPRRAARRGDRAQLQRLRRGDPGAARGVPRRARHRDRRCRARAGIPRADRLRGGGRSPVNRAYLRYELLRTFRNRRFFFFSLGFPLILYFLIAGPNRDKLDLGGTGLSAPLYFMVGLTAFGTMNAMLSAGARIAGERAVGWNRQLRITPLSSRTYFRAKVVTGYVMASITLVALYAAGLVLGVSLTGSEWLRMTGLILVGLIPFAALGIVFGHMLTPDSIGPVMGGTTALLALLGGTWFPITGGVMLKIAEALPSYWLVQAGHVALGGRGWTATGWFVVAAWSVAGAVVAARAYRRDTRRV